MQRPSKPLKSPRTLPRSLIVRRVVRGPASRRSRPKQLPFPDVAAQRDQRPMPGLAHDFQLGGTIDRRLLGKSRPQRMSAVRFGIVAGPPRIRLRIPPTESGCRPSGWRPWPSTARNRNPSFIFVSLSQSFTAHTGQVAGWAPEGSTTFLPSPSWSPFDRRMIAMAPASVNFKSRT